MKLGSKLSGDFAKALAWSDEDLSYVKPRAPGAGCSKLG